MQSKPFRAHQPPCSAPRKDLRLGPDRVRRQELARILERADSVVCSTNRPLEFPPQQEPDTPSIAIGDAINLADKIRIFEQYAKVVSQACRIHDLQGFLSGAHLPPGLEWFEPLRAPVRGNECLEPTFLRLVKLFREAGGNIGDPSPPSAGELYAMQRTLPHVDLELVRYMLRLGRPAAPGYEAHISCHLLRQRPELSWAEHQDRLDAWRDTGLRHPLLLAAAHMPTLNDWLPVDLHREAAGWGEALTELNAARSPEQTEAALAALEGRVDWSGPAGLAVAGTLDRLAVAMRLVSNAAPGLAGLDRALQAFPDWVGRPVGEVWKGVRSALERAIPPSLLCPRLAGFKRPTWGYAALTPAYVDGAVWFAERSLEWVAPLQDAPVVPAAAGDAGRTPKEQGRQSGARLQDVLCRMGEIALSPEMGHLMMLAVEGVVHLRDGACGIREHEVQYCETPALLLHFMRNASSLASDDEDIQDFVDSLFKGLPRVVRVERPLRVVGWRVDPPSRVVLHTGRGLGTVLLDERSDVSHVGGVFVLPGPGVKDPSDPELRRDLSADMLATLRTRLREPIAETVRLDDSRPHTHTALHAGLAEFALRESLLHTYVPLHASSRWENDKEDARYSESQVASNGQRLRDWYAVHRDPVSPQKCRMDSHLACADGFYSAMFPWRREDGTTQWVHVASSVEPQVRVLQARRQAGGDAQGAVGALLASVKGRFMQDLKLLPVRDPSHRIERRNTSVYADRDRGHVLVCYAPTGDPDARIEFMAFGLRP